MTTVALTLPRLKPSDTYQWGAAVLEPNGALYSIRWFTTKHAAKEFMRRYGEAHKTWALLRRMIIDRAGKLY